MRCRYGIWKTYYVGKNVFEGWVLMNNKPVVFKREIGALEFMHFLKSKKRNNATEYQVRKYNEVFK